MPELKGEWTSIVTSPSGLLIRIAVGLTIFAILLAIDLRKHGRRSPRLGEYSFLVVAVLIGAAYGAINDLVTSTISWEYWYYGKDLAASLGPATSPDGWQLHLAAMRIGALASGSAALIGSAILLLANTNFLRGAAPLPLRRLYAYLGFAWAITLVGAVVLGLVGFAGGLAWISSDLRGIVREDLFRPRRFLSVFGIHLGGYIGGVTGTIAACIGIVNRRRRGM